MKNFLSLLLLLTFVTQVESQTIVGRQQVDQYPITAGGTLTYGLTWLPQSYSNTSRKYPLIIFLHGAGEGGTGVSGLNNLITTGIPKNISNGWNATAINPLTGVRDSFIVVSPQAGGWSYNYNSVKYILPNLISRYRVDTERIYLTGLSAGGAGTFSVLGSNDSLFTRKFAAMATSSTAGVDDVNGYNYMQVEAQLRNAKRDGVRVWTVVGEQDYLLDVGVRYHDSTNKLNPAIPNKLTVIATLGHTTWNKQYDTLFRPVLNYYGNNANCSNGCPSITAPNNNGSSVRGSGVTQDSLNVYEWFLINKRSATSTTLPTASAGNNQTINLPINSVTLSGSGTAGSGFSISSYLWTKLSGPSSYNFSSTASASTNVTGLVAGIYIFRFTVINSAGISASSDIQITVNTSNIHIPPTVSASGNQTITLPANSVSVSSTSTVQGSIVSTNWTKFKVPGQTPKKVVVLGSSTSLGNGTTSYDSSYVGRFINYYAANGILSSVVNLANTGSDIGAALPIGNSPLAGLSNPDPLRNVTAALTYYPDIAIVNFPSNGYTIAAVTPNVVGIEAQIIYDAFLAAGVECYITTTQPRDDFNQADQNKLKVIRDTLLNRFGSHCINFYDGLTNPGLTTQIPQYASGDGIHFNNLGHERLFQLVRAKNIFQNKISSSSTILNPTSANTTINSLTAGIHQFQVSVVDADGLAASSTVQVTVNGSGNQTPVANAGNNQTIQLPTNQVTLNGTGSSDPDGTITTYAWVKNSGPASGTITNPAASTTTVTGLIAGVYVFRLTVTDNNGATNSTTVQITVNTATPPINIPPVANAGNNQTIQLPTNQVTLNGTGSSDPDGTITTYAWVKNSGPASGTITNPAATTTTVTGLIAGVYVFRLTVTDNNGATNSTTVQITVNSAGNICNGQRIYITPNDINGIYSGYYTSGASFNPGDTLVIRSSLGPWSYFGLDNVRGTATCPIVVINEGGQVQMKDGIGLSNCEYIKVIGTGSADQYGFKIMDTAVNAEGVAIIISMKSKNIEISNVFVNHKEYGCWVKNEADCDNTVNYPNWTLDNISIHHCYFRNMDSQGFYMGSTDPNNLDRPIICNGVTQYYAPTRLSNIKIYSNIVDSTGRPGIQLSGAMTGSNEIYNNTVTNSGFQFDDAQGVGISLGGYTRAYVHDNVIRKTLTWGIAGIGASGLSRIENNYIDSSGFLGNQSLAWPSNIFFDTRTTIPVDSTTVWIKNNILGTFGSSSYNIAMEDQRGSVGYNNIICSNVKFNGQPATLQINPSIHYTTNCSAPPPNQSPTANAGANQTITLPTSSVTLTGSGTDPDGTIAGYQWTKIAGPAQFIIVSATQSQTAINNLVQGVYQFELRVTDNQGAMGRDTVVITVNAAAPPPNQSPTANAGANQTITLPTSSVTLTGSGTDPDGTIAGYQWTKIAGPAQFIIVSATQSQTAINNLVQGVYQFELRVTDNQGAMGRDTVVITVNAAAPPPNQSPTANAGANQTITLPTSSVTLTGSGTDPDGTIAGYQWTKIAGPAQFIIVSATQSQTAINNLVQGVYQFELRVTDNQGAMGRDTVVITVNAAAPPPNQSPTANAGANQTITLPTSSVTLTGSGTDPDGTIAGYQWTKIAGPAQFIIVSATQSQTAINNLVQGVYQFELRVTDNQGAMGRDTVVITVNAAAPPPNQSPTANAGANQTITLPTSSVTLTGSGTDPDGTIAGYQWTKIAGPAQFIIVSATQSQTAINNLVQGVYQFELRVTDNQGATGRDTVVITVNAAAPPPNQSPTANAGANQTITLPTSSVTLTGSGTDPDGTIAGYQWTKIAGPAQFIIVSATQSQTAINNLVQGVYQFELRVTDNQGATGRDTVVITVNAAAPPPNQSPTANAGANQTITLPTSSVTLTGSGTDPDGTIAGYQWTKIAGPAQFIIVSATQSQTAINNLVQGVYQFELRVTDNQGATGRDTVVITVNAAAPPPNQSPTANAGANQTITLPTSSVTLTGSGTDPDGTIAGYQWTKIAGPAQFIIVSATQSQTAINNLVQGVYQFELRVTDNQGAMGRDTVVITVNAAAPPPNQSPTANAGANQTITLPTSSVTLTGSGTDPDGTIAGYQWTKIAGPAQFIIVSATQSQTAINNLVQGVYQFELRVTDNQGAMGRDTVVITVNAAAPPPNQSPTANAGANQTITLPTSSVTLTGSGTDPDGTIAGYQWTKIAGPAQFIIVSATQSQTAINNLVQGVYQFELRVTDNQGAMGRDTVVITVNAAAPPPNQSPTANAGANQTITLPTSSVTLTGSGTDPDGTIAGYQWTKIAGPAQFIIVSATQSQTAINNLVQGVYQFELRVTDNQGATGRDTVVITVNAAAPPPNQSPTANAGANQTITLPTSSVTLTGSGTDPDGTIAGYQWTKIAGPAQFIIVSATQSQTAINNLVQGVYQFELRVTDNQGATGRDTVVITVNAAPTNRRPEVNAGEDKNITFPTNAVDLIGRAWDADGSIVAYKWSKVSGPIHFRIVTPIQTQTITNNLEVGIYQFELMVTDNQGATAKDTVEITVHKAEVTASFYPNPATDFIQLKIYSKTPVGKAIVKILDGKGTLALTKSFVVSQQQFVESINVSRFSSGAYFILLDIDGIITKLPPLIIQ